MTWPTVAPDLWALWKSEIGWLKYAEWGFWSLVCTLGVVHLARGWARVLFSTHDAERRSGIWEMVRGWLMWAGFDLWLIFKAYLMGR